MWQLSEESAAVHFDWIYHITFSADCLGNQSGHPAASICISSVSVVLTVQSQNSCLKIHFQTSVLCCSVYRTISGIFSLQIISWIVVAVNSRLPQNHVKIIVRCDRMTKGTAYLMQSLRICQYDSICILTRVWWKLWHYNDIVIKN